MICWRCHQCRSGMSVNFLLTITIDWTDRRSPWQWNSSLFIIFWCSIGNYPDWTERRSPGQWNLALFIMSWCNIGNFSLMLHNSIRCSIVYISSSYEYDIFHRKSHFILAMQTTMPDTIALMMPKMNKFTVFAFAGYLHAPRPFHVLMLGTETFFYSGPVIEAFSH